jgi:hypothetical protein
MPDIITLPFPLFDDTDFYHSVGRVFGNGSIMLVPLVPFPVVRPWKECAIHFEEPRSPFKAPLRVTVSDASVARARANAAHAKPRSPEIKPVWEEPAAETVDGTVRRVYSDDELATLARWQGTYSQIKYDAGPFWLKRGRYFGLEERKQHHWRHSDSTKWPETLRRATYTDPTEADLIVAFSRMLYRSAEINRKLEHVYCDAKGKACRSYQAADLYRVYYLAGRRISTTDIICADLVIEAIQGHLRRDVRRIDWTARTAILDMLEGASDRAAAQKHGIHHSCSAQDRYKAEVLGIEAKFGRYCQKWQPRQKPPIKCYNRGVGRRKSAKPYSRAELVKLAEEYFKNAKAAYSWLDDDFFGYLGRMYRAGALRIRIKYLKLRTLPRKANQLIAEYLERGGEIIKAGAAYSGGTAPYRTDKCSNKQVMADRFGETAVADPFKIFEGPKPPPLEADVEYGIDEVLAGTPFLDNRET